MNNIFMFMIQIICLTDKIGNSLIVQNNLMFALKRTKINLRIDLNL